MQSHYFLNGKRGPRIVSTNCIHFKNCQLSIVLKYPPEKTMFKSENKNAGQRKGKNFFLLMTQHLVTVTRGQFLEAFVPTSLRPTLT